MRKHDRLCFIWLVKAAMGAVLAMLLTLFVVFAYGQEASSEQAVIRGSVQDLNSLPIGNALVILLPSSGQPVSSNPDGSFEISSLSPGSYILVVIADGFTPWARHYIDLEQGQTARLEIRLEKSGALDALVTYENPTPQELRNHAKILAVLQEPDFCSAPLPKRAVESYRFLWLRTFHPAVLIHLTILDGEHAVVTYKESDGASGYEIHRLKVNRTFDVEQTLTDRTKEKDKNYLSDMMRAIKEAAEKGLWNQPYRLDDRSITMDGADWIVEGIRSTGCHLVTRTSPNEYDPVRELANLLIKASGKRFYYDEVY